MTLTEKILARAAGKASVQAGDNIWVNADVLMTHGPRYSVLDCADRVLGNLKGASPIQ